MLQHFWRQTRRLWSSKRLQYHQKWRSRWQCPSQSRGWWSPGLWDFFGADGENPAAGYKLKVSKGLVDLGKWYSISFSLLLYYYVLCWQYFLAVTQTTSPLDLEELHRLRMIVEKLKDPSCAFELIVEPRTTSMSWTVGQIYNPRRSGCISLKGICWIQG